MVGTSDTAFSADSELNRAQLVTTLWRLDGEPTAKTSAKFDDVADGMWYTEAINWAVENGIINGYGDGTFGPNNAVTREQVMAILNRYAEYKSLRTNLRMAVSQNYSCSEWAEDNVTWAKINGITAVNGLDNKDMTENATRGEIAAYLARFCRNLMK